MPITKITTRWDGWTGAPGYSNFYVGGSTDDSQTDSAAAAIRTMLNTIALYMPSVVTISWVPTVQIFAEGDGSLAQQRNLTTVPASIAGSSATAFSAATGACLTWRTTTSTGRRLLQGRTFIVPLAVAAYQNDGTLAAAFITAASGAANTYVNRVAPGVPGHPVVWHRPKGGTGGSYADIINATVRDATAVLRSRRD